MLTLPLESALMDTSYDLELDRIKIKIKQLYRDLVVKTYKASNPGASLDDIENFLEQNELEFKGDGFDEEAEDLQIDGGEGQTSTFTCTRNVCRLDK